MVASVGVSQTSRRAYGAQGVWTTKGSESGLNRRYWPRTNLGTPVRKNGAFARTRGHARLLDSARDQPLTEIGVNGPLGTGFGSNTLKPHSPAALRPT